MVWCIDGEGGFTVRGLVLVERVWCRVLCVGWSPRGLDGCVKAPAPKPLHLLAWSLVLGLLSRVECIWLGGVVLSGTASSQRHAPPPSPGPCVSVGTPDQLWCSLRSCPSLPVLPSHPTHPSSPQALVSVSVIGTQDSMSDEQLTAAVLQELSAWFGPQQTATWSHLRTYR
jgi:hypothetical protein